MNSPSHLGQSSCTCACQSSLLLVFLAVDLLMLPLSAVLLLLLLLLSGAFRTHQRLHAINHHYTLRFAALHKCDHAFHCHCTHCV